MRPASLLSTFAATALSALRAISGSPASLILAAALVPAAHSFAQVENVAPYYAVVQRDDAPFRCGEATLYYPVATLKSNTVLRIDGEGGGWVRAFYPANLRAFAKPDDLAPAAGGKSGSLVKPSRLNALNLAGGDRGNWNPLLDKPLPTGTTLTVIDTFKNDAGQTTGYVVAAPPGSRGFLNRDFVRHATPEEIAAHRKANPSEPDLAASPSSAQSAPPQPTPAQPTPAPTEAAPAVINNTGEPPASTPADADSTPTDESAAADNDAAASDDSSTADDSSSSDEAASAPAPAADQPSSIARLTELYTAARKPEATDAELQEVLTEFDRSIALYRASPNDFDHRTADYLARYQTILQIDVEMRNTLRAIDQGAASIDQSAAGVNRSAAAVTPVYAVVGRLLPSGVYDGKSLPKLYRIQSPDRTFTRTLAYVRPSKTVDLDSRLGRFVGITGSARYDEALRLNIYTPDRVDILSPSQVQPQAPIPAPPAAGAQTPAADPAAQPPRDPAPSDSTDSSFSGEMVPVTDPAPSSAPR